MRAFRPRLPADSLARMRLLFVGFTLASAALLLGLMLASPDSAQVTLPAGLLALAALCAKALADYRHPAHHLAWDVLEAGLLLVVGLATGSPLAILLLLYARLSVRAFDGTRASTAGVATAYALAFAGTIAASDGHSGAGHIVEDVLLGSGIPMAAAVMRMLGDILARLDRSTARERVLAEEAAELTVELQRSFSHLFASNPQPMWVHDEETLRFLAVNDAAVHHLGWSHEEFEAMSLGDLDPGDTEATAISPAPSDGRATAIDVARGRRLHTRDGGVLSVETTAHRLRFRGRPAVFVTARDVTEERALHAQLHRQAFHDILTGLPNRALLDDRTAHALKRAQRSGRRPVMLVLDLDGFKGINDTVGHAFGDEVIRIVAERISGCLRPGDTAARLGGDEFAVLLEEVSSAAEAEAVSRRLIEAIEAPYRPAGRTLSLSACIGIAECHDPAAGVGGMLSDADMAMYVAKARGRGAYQVFTPELRTAHRDRQRMQEHLTGALGNGELSVVYQPQVDLATRRITGVEALVRWNNPVHGCVAPDVFIPMAEQLGLITEIDLFVLKTACADLCRWRDGGAPNLRVAVNISGRDLESPTLVEDVRRTVVQHMLDPWQVELELTEGVAVLQPEEAVARLGALRALGIRIGIDDFGTGYSMFSRLRELPIDRLKIDRSFVRDLGTDDDAAAITGSMVAMGHALGLTLVAEGVETATAMELLAELGCDSAQGYFICRPLPPDEFGAWLDACGWAMPRPRVPAV